MKTMTLRDILTEGRERLKEVTTTAVIDTELIVCHVLQLEKLDLLMRPDRALSESEADEIRTLFEKRLAGWPVQYLIGTEGFMGLEFEVTPSVLIPRPDTELLVEKVLETWDRLSPVRILDIGTGSGAIAVSLAHYLKNARVETVDISIEATAVAKRNAERIGVSDRVVFYNGDLFEPVPEGKIYDVIVSNPPYIPSDDIDGLQVEVAVHEPRLALDGGADGYDFYRRIILEAPDHLKASGMLAFETGHDQAGTIAELMAQSGHYKNISIHEDLNHIERVVIGYVL